MIKTVFWFLTDFVGTMLALSVAMLAVFLPLASCSSPPPVIQTVTVTKFVTPDVPAGLLACMAAPAVPVITATDPHGGSEVAALLVQEAVAGQDCRLHVAAIKQALGH